MNNKVYRSSFQLLFILGDVGNKSLLGFLSILIHLIVLTLSVILVLSQNIVWIGEMNTLWTQFWQFFKKSFSFCFKAELTTKKEPNCTIYAIKT